MATVQPTPQEEELLRKFQKRRRMAEKIKTDMTGEDADGFVDERVVRLKEAMAANERAKAEQAAREAALLMEKARKRQREEDDAIAAGVEPERKRFAHLAAGAAAAAAASTASAAAAALDGSVYTPGGPPPSSDPNGDHHDRRYELYVAGLDARMTKVTLIDFFSQYGHVIDAHVVRDRDFGFVSFASVEAMEAALQKGNGALLGTAVIRVSYSKRGSGFRRKDGPAGSGGAAAGGGAAPMDVAAAYTPGAVYTPSSPVLYAPSSPKIYAPSSPN